MKIYTFYSDSHEPLLNGWMETANREPQGEFIAWHIPIPSDGDYQNDEWKEIISFQSFLVFAAMFGNMGSIIGITGVDVRFIRPFVEDVKQLMEENDLLMQSELGDESLFNPDVMFIRCEPHTIRAWMRYLMILPNWGGDMAHQNILMDEAFDCLHRALLPNRYAATRNGGAEHDPVLYHANCLPPPDSVAKKLEALKKYE